MPVNTQSSSPFDTIRRVTRKGVEFWMARELYPFLGYSSWEGFASVIAKAKAACEGNNENPDYHFRQTSKMVEIGSGAQRAREDWFLDRLACYLCAMNSDSSKAEVGLAQAYF